MKHLWILFAAFLSLTPNLRGSPADELSDLARRDLWLKNLNSHDTQTLTRATYNLRAMKSIDSSTLVRLIRSRRGLTPLNNRQRLVLTNLLSQINDRKASWFLKEQASSQNLSPLLQASSILGLARLNPKGTEQFVANRLTAPEKQNHLVHLLTLQTCGFLKPEDTFNPVWKHINNNLLSEELRMMSLISFAQWGDRSKSKDIIHLINTFKDTELQKSNKYLLLALLHAAASSVTRFEDLSFLNELSQSQDKPIASSAETALKHIQGKFPETGKNQEVPTPKTRDNTTLRSLLKSDIPEERFEAILEIVKTKNRELRLYLPPLLHDPHDRIRRLTQEAIQSFARGQVTDWIQMELNLRSPPGRFDPVDWYKQRDSLIRHCYSQIKHEDKDLMLLLLDLNPIPKRHPF